jgi:RNA polymerase sigma-70 factor (ECF subfamily)
MTNQEFEIFVERTRPKLLAIAHQYLSVTADAEDVVQEALLKLYAMRQRLDTYHSVDALAVVVKRLALNTLRNEKRHPATTLDERVTSYEEPPSEERYIELLRAIDALPDKQQMILRMKHMEGMDIAEIAELAGMSHDAIYQNLSRARRAILEQFKNRKNG